MSDGNLRSMSNVTRLALHGVGIKHSLVAMVMFPCPEKLIPQAS